MSSAAIRVRCTPEEYLVLERRAEFRHEYRDGIVTAMAGTSKERIRIVVNLAREIDTQLLERPCQVYVTDLRLAVTNAGLYTYPDLAVVCGEPRFLDDQFDTLLNPNVLIEVLSPSTEAYDRGEKFDRYKTLDSLREYVLVAQDRAHVERYARQGDEWILTEYDRPEDILRLDSIDCEVPLHRIYIKVPLPDREPPAGA
jgi:Uma2 family endonuclease